MENLKGFKHPTSAKRDKNDNFDKNQPFGI